MKCWHSWVKNKRTEGSGSAFFTPSINHASLLGNVHEETFPALAFHVLLCPASIQQGNPFPALGFPCHAYLAHSFPQRPCVDVPCSSNLLKANKTDSAHFGRQN